MWPWVCLLHALEQQKLRPFFQLSTNLQATLWWWISAGVSKCIAHILTALPPSENEAQPSLEPFVRQNNSKSEGFRLNATCSWMNQMDRGMNEMGIGSVSCTTRARARAQGSGASAEGMYHMPLQATLVFWWILFLAAGHLETSPAAISCGRSGYTTRPVPGY